MAPRFRARHDGVADTDRAAGASVREGRHLEGAVRSRPRRARQSDHVLARARHHQPSPERASPAEARPQVGDRAVQGQCARHQRSRCGPRAVQLRPDLGRAALHRGGPDAGHRGGGRPACAVAAEGALLRRSGLPGLRWRDLHGHHGPGEDAARHRRPPQRRAAHHPQRRRGQEALCGHRCRYDADEPRGVHRLPGEGRGHLAAAYPPAQHQAIGGL